MEDIDRMTARIAALIAQATTTPTDREEIRRLYAQLLTHLTPRFSTADAARAALDAAIHSAVRAVLDADPGNPVAPEQMMLNL
jgi:formate-dependent phosphoribosylglycinamide formyltransferase (GAR transformylase)